jgi:hypothetical protein
MLGQVLDARPLSFEKQTRTRCGSRDMPMEPTAPDTEVMTSGFAISCSVNRSFFMSMAGKRKFAESGQASLQHDPDLFVFFIIIVLVICAHVKALGVFVLDFPRVFAYLGRNKSFPCITRFGMFNQSERRGSPRMQGAVPRLYKQTRTYATAAVMAAVLSPLILALIPGTSGKYISFLTMPFVPCAWAQSAAPDQPATPAQPQEGDGASQQTQEQQPGPKQPSSQPGEPSMPLPFEQNKPAEMQLRTTIIDIVHDQLSKEILNTATYLDSFFGNQRYLAEANQSYVRLRYNVFLEHESPMQRRPEVDVRVVLPQLREKTHLEFAGTPRNASNLSATQAPSAIDQYENPSQSNFAATISQFFKQTHRVNFVMRAGLQWHNGGPVVILGPRLRLLFPLGDKWSFRFIEELTLRNDTGYQSTTTFDLERPLPHDLFFRASNNWIRTDHVPGYTYTAIFTMDHPLSPKRALQYEWDNIFQTQPTNELTEIDLRVRYRQMFWRKWLFFEVAPQYRFPRDREFEPTPGILFRLEAIFGHV